MKLPPILEALHDTVTDHVRVRMTPEDISVACHTLARSVAEKYKADVVIAIATGGIIPGELIAHELNLPFDSMVIRRNINIKRMYNKDPLPLRWLMSFYHHFLFHVTKPVILKGVERNVAGMNVLLVDDAFHTGVTADAAIEYLGLKKAASVRTASLSYVSKRKPDFSVLPKGNYCYPWSKDYAAKPPQTFSR